MILARTSSIETSEIIVSDWQYLIDLVIGKTMNGRNDEIAG